MNAITTRECHAWEPLMRWAKENSPSHANGPILEHPVLGKSTLRFSIKSQMSPELELLLLIFIEASLIPRYGTKRRHDCLAHITVTAFT